MAKHWTKAEIETLRELWGKQTRDVIASTLGRSDDAVYTKAHDLGLIHQPFNPVPSALMSTGKLAMMLGVSSRSVEKWCRLGLPHVHHGKWKWIRLSDLAGWLREHWQVTCSPNFTPTGRDRMARFVASMNTTNSAA